MAKSDLERQLELIEKAQQGMAEYQELLRSIGELQKNINYVKGKAVDLDREILELNAEIRAHEEGIIKLEPKILSSYRLQIASKKDALKQQQKIIKAAEDEVRLRRDAVEQVNEYALGLKSAYIATKKLGHLVLRQTGYWLEQQKGVKETELSMGILSNQAVGFRKNIYQTSLSTTQIGVNTKELAKMQGTYADSVGRGVQLNEEQLQAIAEMGRGTKLGTEAAAELAGQFERVGMGAEGTAEFIDESLQLATKMGTSANATIKNIQKNFRLLNKYNFEGGVEGFGKMAALATKFKFEMESIAGFADDLMTPEGAVEVASKLQVLGGEWAKLGDPFELMYKSRNDITGLTEDVINATKATATFDESTGEFRISPMELQRLREVAAVTGLNAEELAEMAKQSAKFDKIETLIPSTFSDEDKKYLSSLAQFDKKTGKYKITLQTQDETITENLNDLKSITPEMIKVQRAYTDTLEERAKNSLTFNERFNNITQTLQSAFLPAFEKVAGVFERFVGWLEPLVKDFADWIQKLPDALVGAIGVGLAATALLGDMAMWIIRGKWLRMGFGGPEGGGTSQIGGKLFGGMTKGGGLKGFGGNIGKGLGSMGAIGGGLLSAGFSGYDEYTSNKESGMDTSENVGRTVARGAGAGLGGWGGAAAGAAIGTAILPVVGTLIGGLIGGGLGAWGGDSLGDSLGDSIYGDSGKPATMNDFIVRPDSEPVSFSPQDTVVGAKEGGPIDKMLGQIEKPQASPGNNIISLDTSEALVGIGKSSNIGGIIEGQTPVNSSGSEVKVKFEDAIKFEGKIEVASNNQQTEIDLKDPILMRNLSKIIMEELSKAISGGKISSNPVPA